MVWASVANISTHKEEPDYTGSETGRGGPVFICAVWYEPIAHVSLVILGIANSIALGLVCFFSFMTITEGGGRRALTRKFQDVYIPTLKANFLIWPAVQVLNFRVVPIQFQIVS